MNGLPREAARPISLAAVCLGVALLGIFGPGGPETGGAERPEPEERQVEEPAAKARKPAGSTRDRAATDAAQREPADQNRASARAGKRESGGRETGGGSRSAHAGPRAVRGVPKVIDTARLLIGGRLVRLYGVNGNDGRSARGLRRYIGGRRVRCQPHGRAFKCVVDGYDLSEVVLFNGGGTAKPGVPAALVQAQQKAQRARRGIWSPRRVRDDLLLPALHRVEGVQKEPPGAPRRGAPAGQDPRRQPFRTMGPQR